MWWLRRILRRRRDERELEEEISFDLDQEAQLRVESGDSPEDARTASRRDFGNVGLILDNTRAIWDWGWLERAAQDVRYAWRGLRQNPGFTMVAIASLALGIGANTAIFSLVDAMLIQSLPVREPGQLRLVLWTGKPRIPLQLSSGFTTALHGVQTHSSFSYPIYRALAEGVPQFSDLMGFASGQLTVVARGQSHYAGGTFVTGNFFTGLGLEPLFGRVLGPGDDRAGAPPAAVITYAYWERSFGLDPSVVGQDILVNGRPVLVAGVLGRSFRGLEPGRAYDLFLPMAQVASLGPEWYALQKADYWWVEVLGRLRPAVSAEAARAAVQAVIEHAGEAFAERPKQKREPWRAILERGDAGPPLVRKQVATPLLILSGAVALVLLIACANLANLLLARGTTRRREMALRLALGARRSRLIGQLLTESLLLAVMGAVMGLAFASPLARGILSLAAEDETLSLDLHVDGDTLLFTIAAAILTAVLFGLAPALRATRVDLTPALKEGGGGTSRGRAHFRMSRLLVVAQVTLSTVLLAGAGLFVRSLGNLARIDPGFNARQLVIFDVDGSRSGYVGDKLTTFYERIREQAEKIPGVRSATVSSFPLIGGGRIRGDITIPGYTAERGGSAMAYTMVVGRRFFETMEIPILAGRALDERDAPNAPRVAVVNDTFARKYMGNENPIGRTFSRFDRPTYVIGVSRDARYDTLKHEVEPTVYLPMEQDAIREATFELRTPLPLASIAAAVRNIVAGSDRGVPVANIRTQEEQIRTSIAKERLFAGAVSLFGAVAVLLVAIGLYGLMAYTVARRTVELGIRLALGASAREVQRMVLRESLGMVILGMAIGIPAALGLTRLVRQTLFGLNPWDPTSFEAAGLLMLAVAVAAAWLPARHAARVDVMRALRQE